MDVGGERGCDQMSAKKATPPQKGPNLFSLFAKVAEKNTQKGADNSDPVKKQPQQPVVDLTGAAAATANANDAKSPRAPLKNVDNAAGAAATNAHTKSGRIVVETENSRRISSGGEGGGGEDQDQLQQQQSPQASVGDAFMTPAHGLREKQQHDTDTPMTRGDDTPSATTVSSKNSKKFPVQLRHPPLPLFSRGSFPPPQSHKQKRSSTLITRNTLSRTHALTLVHTRWLIHPPPPPPPLLHIHISQQAPAPPKQQSAPSTAPSSVAASAAPKPPKASAGRPKKDAAGADAANVLAFPTDAAARAHLAARVTKAGGCTS